MKVRHAVLVAVAAAVTLSSVAAAGTEATKQRVAITIKGLPNGSFALTSFKAGPLKRDSGTVSISYGSPRVVIRDGQRLDIFSGVYTFDGRRGSLTVRERNEWRTPGATGTATATSTVSPSAPGRSFAGPASTLGLSGAAGVLMPVSATRGMHASRASSRTRRST